MVARLVRDQEVVGSNPVASTTKQEKAFRFLLFCISGEVIRGSWDERGKSQSTARTSETTLCGGYRRETAKRRSKTTYARFHIHIALSQSLSPMPSLIQSNFQVFRFYSH